MVNTPLSPPQRPLRASLIRVSLGILTAVDDEKEPLVFEDQPEVSRIVKVAAKYGIEIPVPIA